MLRLCWPHADGIASNALAAAELWHDLAEALAGGSAGLSEAVSATPDRGLKFNGRASAARTEISHVLTQWVGLIADERGWSLPDEDIDSRAKFVHTSAQWLAAHELAGECSAELHRIVWGANRSVVFGGGWRSYPVGACRVDWCAGEVRAHLRRANSLQPSELRCGLDETHRWQPHEWAEFAAPAEREPLTSVEAALMLGVSVSSVYAYASRGRLRGAGGRYPFDAVLRLRGEIWSEAA